MRFIHTSDWHLGRLFHGGHLTDDQAYVLEQLLCLAQEVKPDALLICGDVYDRPVPPAEAVKLLDETLSRLVVDLKVPAIVIAGNHDSAIRLGYGSRVLSGNRLHVFGALDSDSTCVTLHDEFGPVRFCALPYAEPSAVGALLREDFGNDHQAAMNRRIELIRKSLHPGERSVVLAHAFVSGAKESDSERPLSVGGTDRIAPDCLQGFDYVALGHLHRPQAVSSDRIRYSGALMKYSFSESEQARGVNLVEMDRSGDVTVTRVPLTPRRDVVRIEGALKDLVANPELQKHREDYIMVTLLDTDAILDAMGKLRKAFPHIRHLERSHLSRAETGSRSRRDHRSLNDVDLFAAFFREATGEELNDVRRAAYERLVDNLRRSQREEIS